MNNGKVATITFHNSDNLGAVLQAYALQAAIEKNCGRETEIIDYSGKLNRKTDKPKSLKGKLKAIPKNIYYSIKHRGFERFRKEKLKLSKPYSTETIFESIKDYDVFITGSDQVWNLECSEYDYSYFLDFVPEDKKKCSYAASLGVYKYKPEEENVVTEHLKTFHTISVREKSAVDELKKLGVNQAYVNADPVVLLSVDEWKTIMPERLYKDKYVLVYLIQEDVNVMKFAQDYANANNYKIISNKKSIEFILHNSPAEFLSWIYHAECVFTNSFHGTAFSLIFDKPLGADTELVSGKINNRVNEILTACDSKNLILNDKWQPASAGAEKAIAEMRDDGIAYLKNICK